jgi:hypothetical protein
MAIKSIKPQRIIVVIWKTYFVKCISLKAPVRIDFKTSENPFEGRKSQIDERVAARKRRYVQNLRKLRKI